MYSIPAIGALFQIKLILTMFHILIWFVGPVPKDQGITAVVDYLLDNLVNESCVKQAMETLVTLTKLVFEASYPISLW